MSLTGKQRRFLRAEAHSLEPVVMVGKEGLSETVLSAVRDALQTHELIKVRVLESAPMERKDVAEALPGLVTAELAGLVGRVLILYKRHPKTPKVPLPQGH